MEEIIQQIFKTCEKITGNLPDSLDSLKSELKSFIKSNGGGDFIIDDLRSLFEISVIYSSVDLPKLIDNDFYDHLELFMNNHNLEKDEKITINIKEGKNKIELIAEEIIKTHGDLDYKISGTNVSFFNMKGYIFSYYDIYTVKGLNELIGNVKLFKVQSKAQLYPLLENKLIMKKNWRAPNKGNGLIGYDITVNELHELILNRKIINYSKND